MIPGRPPAAAPANGDDEAAKLLRDLEIPQLLALVEARCASKAGQRALRREPHPTPARAADDLDRTGSARRARAVNGAFAFACETRPEDVRGAGVQGLILPVEVLLALYDGARAAAAAKEQIEDQDRRGWERFGAEIDALPDLPGYRAAAGRVFDERGQVRDDATPRLFEIRQRQKALKKEIERELAAVLRSDQRRWLSDEFVTQRDGRWVVPLSADHRGKIKGVVVGTSKTGATLYVEPFRVVELNNELRTAEAEEAAEIRLIMERLTALVAEVRDQAEVMVIHLAELDALHAKAGFAEEHGCVLPAFSEDGTIRIRDARHVLLGRDCVPIDLETTAGARVLILSGANAGGKTVALKVFGTLTYLAACGYPVPAREGAVVPFPRRFHCVIGDEQSLAHHLSSFSSHARHVAEVLATAREGDLVLLDELMGATDPEEGAALAVEVLLELADRRVSTVATTHHSAVKLLARDHKAFANAAVEFDAAKLRPTYRILPNQAGASRGFEIAERFGLPAALVEKARLRLGPARQRLEELLQGIEGDRFEAALARREAEALEARIKAREAEIVELKKELKRRSYEEEKERARALDAELTELRRRVLEALESGRTGDAARLIEERAETRVDLPEAPPQEGWESLAVGDKVQVGGYGVVGTLVSIDPVRKVGMVTAGAITLEGDLTQMTRAAGKAAGKAGKPGRGTRPSPAPREPGAALVTREVHLLGMRVDEAREALESALDKALSDGAEALRVVHGFGTGALRGMVQQTLKDHALVAEVRPGGESEGGRGATVAILK